MKEELMDRQVLVMYDVRGIQDYIFKTNAAKEIIGASTLVEQIITDGISAYIGSLDEVRKKHYLKDWIHDDPRAFLDDPSVEMQIMFVGGGNAYVLFRKGSECQRVTRFLGCYLLENTYSLKLVAAAVEKTEDYREDYRQIHEEMRHIKAGMPFSMPMGALPFMEADPVTGYPLTHREQGAYFSAEAILKRRAFPTREDEKIFDNMVTEKGDNSSLAVFHIDGNSMGKRIMKEMQGIRDYREAIVHMRRLSCEIADGFRAAVDKMKAYMDKLSPLVKKDISHKLYREIITAGDDITFVCNVKLAIPAVTYFLEHIGDEGDFTACGGIAFFNSHFPFSDAYQVAEACCDSAKKKAKEQENRGEDDRIGCFLDYQLCTNVRASQLEDYRDRHYRADGELFIARPYYIPAAQDPDNINKRNEGSSVDLLNLWQKYFSEIPRSRAKYLRDIIPMGKNEIQKGISFLGSRGYQQLVDSQEEYRVWYDALEIMDWFIKEGGHGN